MQQDYAPESIAMMGLLLTDIYMQDASTLRGGDLLNCALEVFGLNFIDELASEIGGGITWNGVKRVMQSPAGKRFALRIVKRAALNTVGGIGAAIMMYEMADCMLS